MRLSFVRNLGAVDRIIRIAVGLFLVWLAFTGIARGWWAAAAAVFAVLQFVEAASAY